MKSVKELLAHCKAAVKNNVQYVYGAKMQVLSTAQIKNLQNIYGKNMVWDSDIKKAGSVCCDCSGLISSLTGIMRNSSMYKATALAAVSIAEYKKDPSKYIGWGLWMQGHIGVASDTLGYYYACDGSARNTVHLPINRQNFSMAIKLCDIDYGESAKEEIADIRTILLNIGGKTIFADAILRNDTTFLKLRDLEKAGYKISYDPKTKIRSITAP